MRVLLIDNHDSFTFNLAQLIGRFEGVEVVVVANDWEGLEPAYVGGFDAVVISPGPGRPGVARDLGAVPEILRQPGPPVLGVCLGMQAICHINGGRVAPSPEPVHGRPCRIEHTGDGLMEGIPSPFTAIRYHSLHCEELGPDLEPIARGGGVVMALRHRSRPQWGVQFHPESIRSEHGERLLLNFLRQAGPVSGALRPAPEPRGAGRPGAWRVVHRTLERTLSAAEIHARFFRDQDNAVWLDTAMETGAGHVSILADTSGPHAERIRYQDGHLGITTHQGVETRSSSIFEYLEDALEDRKVPPSGLPFEFNLGFVGYFGYELKDECGGARLHRADTPDAAWLFVDRAMVIDHAQGALTLLELRGPGDGPSAWFDDVEAALSAPIPAIDAASAAPLGPVERRHDAAAYLERIAACQEEIHRGESYEICLTNELTLRGDPDPVALYTALRQTNPAPYAALLRFGTLHVLSSSPERFLHISAAGVATSKPIKGTAPRGPSADRDLALRDALARDEKERSENLMIVDLVRNDLGRVCLPGGVDVPLLFDVESYATVHQLVSTVRGVLAAGMSAIDCIRSCFPAGSMTGAPKQRTMEIIDRLEGGPRGPYSGALGYLALSGAVDLSVVIRTLILTPGAVRIGTGGAITALSDPQSELQEAELKAAALLDALRVR